VWGSSTDSVEQWCAGDDIQGWHFFATWWKNWFFHGKTVLAKIIFSGKGLFSPIGKKLQQKLFFQLETSIFHCFTVFRCPGKNSFCHGKIPTLMTLSCHVL